MPMTVEKIEREGDAKARRRRRGKTPQELDHRVCTSQTAID